MASPDIGQDIERLKSDIQDLRNDISTLAQSLRELGSAQGEEALARLRDVGDRARQRTVAAETRFEQQVESHPLTSVLTAFGVGFVMGLVLDRRR